MTTTIAESETETASAARQSRPADGALDQEVPLEWIEPSPHNPRRAFDEAELAELAESIRQLGVLEPVLVRPLAGDGTRVRYELVAGERRWRAARLAGRSGIPARVLRDLSDQDAVRLALVENLQRRDLDPLEEAEGYRTLQGLGLKQAEIAAAVHRSQPTIANALRLLELPDDVQSRIRAGELSAAHGRALCRFSAFPAIASKIAEVAVAEKLSSKELEKGVPATNALDRAGLTRSLWSATFDTSTGQCARCPHDARRKADLGDRCLRPACFDELQAAARARLDAARAAGQEAGCAAAAAGQVLELGGLRGYMNLKWSPVPAGCSEACPCRAQALDGAGALVPVCLDLARYDGLAAAQREAESAARQAALEDDLAAVTGALDHRAELASLGGYVAPEDEHAAVWLRELALLVALVLSRGCRPSAVKATVQRLALALNVPADPRAWGEPGRLETLAALPVSALLRLGVESVLRDELAFRAEYSQGREAALTGWYLQPLADQSAAVASALSDGREATGLREGTEESEGGQT